MRVIRRQKIHTIQWDTWKQGKSWEPLSAFAMLPTSTEQ